MGSRNGYVALVLPHSDESGGPALTVKQITDALDTHGSVAGAAAALGVGRDALTAQAQRHGLRPGPDIPPDLIKRYQAGASIRELAEHYQRGTSTIVRWLDGAGLTRRRRGRQPRDG